MGLEIKDPATGKIKPVFIIAGVAIGGLALYLIIGNSSSSSTSSDGTTSSDTTDALAGLQDAINNLSGGGGSDSSSGTSSTSGSTSSGSDSSGASSGASYSSDYSNPNTGDSNVSPSVGTPYLESPQAANTATTTPKNSYGLASVAQATVVAKPSNSGLSSSPQSSSLADRFVASQNAAQQAVGKGATVYDAGPSGSKSSSTSTTKSVVSTVVTPVTAVFDAARTKVQAAAVVTAKQQSVGKGATESDSGPSGSKASATALAVAGGYKKPSVPTATEKAAAAVITAKQQAVGKGAQQ